MDIVNPISRDQTLSIPTPDFGELKLNPLGSGLRIESTSFASLLGAWAANTCVGTNSNDRLSFAAAERSRLRPIRTQWNAFIGETPPLTRSLIDGKIIHRVEIPSKAISEHIHFITNHNRRVPWEHLYSVEEQRAYLKAVFNHGGWIALESTPGIGIKKDSGKALLREIAVLMTRFEIYPLQVCEDPPSLRLRGRQDWIQFRKELGYEHPSDRKKLSRLCNLNNFKKSHSIAQYYAVMSEGNDNLTTGEIERKTGVTRSTILDWRIRGQIPPIVKRRDLLLRCEKKIPDIEAVAFAYRYLEVDSDTARTIGRRWNLEHIFKRINEEVGLLGTLKGNPEKLIKFFERETRREESKRERSSGKPTKARISSSD